MTVKIVTLGCKVNQAESEALAARLASEGFTIAAPAVAAGDVDRVIVNTCAVTAEAGRKSRQAIRHAMGECADVRAIGCYAKLEPKALAGATIAPAPEYSLTVANPASGLAFNNRQKAYLKIQDGCDNHCTYCVIPSIRGKSRTVPIEEISRTLERFYLSGCRQVVITGIEIASYGADCGTSLTALLLDLKRQYPDLRFWLGSLEPRWLTAENIKPLVGIIEPEFHISVQSGSDTVLKRMGRKYTVNDVKRGIELIRALFISYSLSTDIIAGFPGETEAEFSETREFLGKTGFNSLHVFPYSVRPGTPAASMSGQIPKAGKLARAAELRRGQS
jgi:threonylcarbamoyladenosine tRNA methylthiotransferase MtaB